MKNLMGVFSAAAVAFAAVLPQMGFAIGVPGMYQKLYSKSDVSTGDPADGGVVIKAGAGLSAVKAGNPRVRGKSVDIGCYESTPAGFRLFLR